MTPATRLARTSKRTARADQNLNPTCMIKQHLRSFTNYPMYDRGVRRIGFTGMRNSKSNRRSNSQAGNGRLNCAGQPGSIRDDRVAGTNGGASGAAADDLADPAPRDGLGNRGSGSCRQRCRRSRHREDRARQCRPVPAREPGTGAVRDDRRERPRAADRGLSQRRRNSRTTRTDSPIFGRPSYPRRFPPPFGSSDRAMVEKAGPRSAGNDAATPAQPDRC